MSLYEKHLEAYYAEFNPRTNHESFLVQMMAHARWKLERMQHMEVKLLDLVLADAATPAQTQLLASLQKYTAAAERSYYKALKEFYAGRKTDAKAEHIAMLAEIQAIANAPLPNLGNLPDLGLAPEPASPKIVSAPRRL